MTTKAVALCLAMAIANVEAFSVPALTSIRRNNAMLRPQGKGLRLMHMQRKDEAVQTSFPKTTESISDANKLDMLASEGVPNELLGTGGAATQGAADWFDPLLWRGVVVVLCGLWASNFAAAKMIMAEPGVDSSLYAVARFSAAALALIPGSLNAARKGAIDMQTAMGAAVCGSWVAFGYLGQTLGLLTTTASKSCVICSMHCVFVAIVAEWTRVSRLRESATDESELGEEAEFNLLKLAPAALAVLGVAIVELKGAGGDPSIGDLLSFAQPIGFGLGYIQLEDLMAKRPEAALPVSCIKLCMVVLGSLTLFEVAPLLHGDALTGIRIPDLSPILHSPAALGGILYTGLVTTALALWVESIAFKRVPATDASIILTTEPLFAAAAGSFFLGETFGFSDYFGASLIIGACVVAVLLQGNDEEHGAVDSSEN